MTARIARTTAHFLLALGLAVGIGIAGIGQAGAAEAPVGLGTATSFAVLAGSTVTNTGPSTISGDLGVSPGTAVTGFPPGTVINGTIHAANATAAQAQADLTTAYNDAAGRSPTANVSADLAGQTFVGGVYRGPTLGLTGTVTLDGQGDPATVWIFQAGSTLITASSSVVQLINGAQPCNVFWQVGSSATLGTNTAFVGSILALTSITANTQATVAGRLLARNGAVTLDNNTVSRPFCAAQTTTTSTTAAPGATTTSTTAAPGATTTSTTAAPGATTTSTTAALGATTTSTTAAPGATTTTAPTTPGATTTTTQGANPTTTAGPGVTRITVAQAATTTTTRRATAGPRTPGPTLPITGTGTDAVDGITLGALLIAAGALLLATARRMAHSSG